MRIALILLVTSCATGAEITQDQFDTLEEELATRVTCYPRKAVAFSGDRIQIRSTGNYSLSTSAGSIDGSEVFTAPQSFGEVTVTATNNQNGRKSYCKINVIRRPNPNEGDGEGAALSVHTSLGLPGPVSSSAEHYLVVHDSYVISYNQHRKGPNWVAWELNGRNIGGSQRTNNWRMDPELPDENEARDSDYANSGYARGHMCASADRSRTVEDTKNTFILSNALPQTSASNSGPWKYLESDLQKMAGEGHEIFIVAGGIFGSNPPTIGDGVAVPHTLWKVAVILDDIGERAPDVTTHTDVIAIMIPNDDSVTQSDAWEDFVVRVDDIEAATGLDLLSDVRISVQNALE